MGLCLSTNSRTLDLYLSGEADIGGRSLYRSEGVNETVEELLKKAEALMKDEKFNDASKIFLEAYKVDESGFRGLDYMQMAYALRMAGDSSTDVITYYDKAIDDFAAKKDEYVEKRGRKGWVRLMRMAHFGKAMVYNKNLDYEEAAKAYKAVLNIYTENRVTEDLDLVYMRLGDVCMKTNSYDMAIKNYNAACKYRLMGPDNMSERRAKRMQQTAADDVEQSDPILGKASYNIALCYKELNDLDSYINFVKRAANLGNHEAQIAAEKMPDQTLNAGM